MMRLWLDERSQVRCERKKERELEIRMVVVVMTIAADSLGLEQTVFQGSEGKSKGLGGKSTKS